MKQRSIIANCGGFWGDDPDRAAPPGRRRSHRLPGHGLPRRSDDGDPAEAARAQAGSGLSGRLSRCSCATCCPSCVERGIRVITNAGGVNPLGCRAAVEALAKELGVADRVKVAIVRRRRSLSEISTRCSASGEPLVNMDTGQPLVRCSPARAVGERVHRRRRHRQGAGARRQRDHHRACGRRGGDAGADDVRVRMVARRIGIGWRPGLLPGTSSSAARSAPAETSPTGRW